MATKTSLLGLTKPAYTDAADIAVLNGNFDLIDKAVGNGMRAENLLDNSDFSAARFIAAAGLNGKHGTAIYLGDRWRGSASITATQQADGVLLTASAQSTYIYQKVSVKAGQKYTLAVYAAGRTGMHRIAAYNSTNSVIYEQDYASDRDMLIANFTAGEDVASMLYYPGFASGGGSAVLQWAALYPGTYTADTLPAYVYKGYAAELAECQRYFVHFGPYESTGFMALTARMSVDTCRASFPLPVTMRAMRPTISFSTCAVNGMKVTAMSGAEVQGANLTAIATCDASAMSYNAPLLFVIQSGGYVNFSADL